MEFFEKLEVSQKCLWFCVAIWHLCDSVTFKIQSFSAVQKVVDIFLCRLAKVNVATLVNNGAVLKIRCNVCLGVHRGLDFLYINPISLVELEKLMSLFCEIFSMEKL